MIGLVVEGLFARLWKQKRFFASITPSNIGWQTRCTDHPVCLWFSECFANCCTGGLRWTVCQLLTRTGQRSGTERWCDPAFHEQHRRLDRLESQRSFWGKDWTCIGFFLWAAARRTSAHAEEQRSSRWRLMLDHFLVLWLWADGRWQMCPACPWFDWKSTVSCPVDLRAVIAAGYHSIPGVHAVLALTNGSQSILEGLYWSPAVPCTPCWCSGKTALGSGLPVPHLLSRHQSIEEWNAHLQAEPLSVLDTKAVVIWGAPSDDPGYRHACLQCQLAHWSSLPMPTSPQSEGDCNTLGVTP